MNILSTIAKSFYSVDAYRNAAFNWKWKALLYFLAISLIASGTSSFMIARAFDSFCDMSLKPAFEQMKDMKIVNGKVVTNDGKDIYLKTHDGNVFAIASQNYIDATQTKNLLFAFEKDRITAYQNGEESSFPLADAKLENVEGKEFVEALPSIKSIAVVAIPFLALLFTILTNAIYVTLLSVAAVILSATMMPSLGVWRCVRIAVVSITPPIIINAVMMLAFNQILPDFLYALISGGLIWFAITTMRKQAVESQDPKKDLP